MKLVMISLILLAVSFSCLAQSKQASNREIPIEQPELVVMIARALKLGVEETNHFYEPFRSPHSYILVERGSKNEVNRLVIVSFEMGSFYELSARFDRVGNIGTFQHRLDIASPERASGSMTTLKQAPQGYTGTVQLGWNGEIVQLIELPPNAKVEKRKAGG